MSNLPAGYWHIFNCMAISHCANLVVPLQVRAIVPNILLDDVFTVSHCMPLTCTMLCLSEGDSLLGALYQAFLLGRMLMPGVFSHCYGRHLSVVLLHAGQDGDC